MKNIILGILLLISYAKSDECWSEQYNFPCCSPGVKIDFTDNRGSWGLENYSWCGIISESNINTSNADSNEYCWANYIDQGYGCCLNDNGKREIINMDGEWGLENDNWCGFRNSTSRWNDREKVDATRNEWNAFKQKWDNEYKNNFERLSVFVGEDESMLNFGWYSTTAILPLIRYSLNEDMSDAKEFSGVNTYFKELVGTPYYSNKVTITGLNRKSTYYYQRNLNGEWEDPVKFSTYDPDNFNFIFVGDPQIGGSNGRLSVSNKTKPLTVSEGTRNDAFNWNLTVTNSFVYTKEPSVFLSAGDQADTDCYEMNDENHFNQETQYSAFLLPELLKTIPSAVAVGNHESYTNNHRYHFNPPNAFTTPKYTQQRDFGGIIPGYSYFFKYNNVLVIVLETNYNNCEDFEKVINDAVNKYPEADWRIAMFHHDIYGNGNTHSKEEYITNTLRPCLTELFYENAFDLVINGHDHVYSTSHFISYSQKYYDPYKINEIEKNKVYNDPKGTLYITANCSTGSKFFGFIEDTPDYIQYYNQTFTATFGVLDFKKENGKLRLSVTTYEVETQKEVDDPYIFEKSSKKSNKWTVILIIIILLLLLLISFLIYCIVKRRKESNTKRIRMSSDMANSATYLNTNYKIDYYNNYENVNLDRGSRTYLHRSSLSHSQSSDYNHDQRDDFDHVPPFSSPQNLYLGHPSQNKDNNHNESSLLQNTSFKSLDSKNDTLSTIHSFSSSRQKNFFDAGGNVELNKDLYLRTLNNLRNNQFVGYANQNEVPDHNLSSLTTTCDSQLNDKSYSRSFDVQLSKSKNNQCGRRSFDAQQPSKSYATHPSKSFDVQTTGLLGSPLSRSPTVNPTEISTESGQPLSMSLGGIDEESGEINSITAASGMIVSKDDINKKMGLSYLSKIEEPDISLTSIDDANESIDRISAVPNISNVGGSQAMQDMDISVSSVGKNEEIVTEVSNIVEASFNFEVKNNARSSKTSSGLISSPSLVGQVISSPKFTSSTTRNKFGLKRMSPLYLSVSNTRPSATVNPGVSKDGLLRSPKQVHINIPSPKKTFVTYENSEDSSLRINLNKFNEKDLNKIKITKNNVDGILL
ncbi:Metallo-dependent phosphatase [Piromyces finnis]|uniref:Purple acid phosphatase n=1 Tax=Piromyces finnis TaxID=1754191 RepID=A0A1Y1V6P7_9FUNG|nr:Metallo-dependent phosphatase [Piromyces finnis]|eukprot:ORX47824.1 Metallo-dependent phosphatase [Piromyces finnis]